MEKKIRTNSPERTISLAKGVAKDCLKKGPNLNGQAIIFALSGDLGSGKTTFVQGFAKGLGITEKILSPTFVILKRFKIAKPKDQSARIAIRPRRISGGNPKSKTVSPKFKNFYHIDCYRLKGPKEIRELGFEEIASDPNNIVMIEWAEKIKEALSKNIVVINFEFKDKNSREIIIKSKYDFR